MSMPNDVSKSEDGSPTFAGGGSRRTGGLKAVESVWRFDAAGSGVLKGLAAATEGNVPFIPRLLLFGPGPTTPFDVPNLSMIGDSSLRDDGGLSADSVIIFCGTA